MAIHFVDMDLDGRDVEDVIDFMIRNRFPYDRVVNPTEDQARAAVQASLAAGDDRRSFWIEDDELGRVGMAQIQDLNRAGGRGPNLDIRLDGARRGKGLGVKALRAFVPFIFNAYPDLDRMEGRTREDNAAIRQVLAQCGFVKEAHLREAWPVDGEDSRAEVIYGLLRRDWESNTLTPVIFNDIGF